MSKNLFNGGLFMKKIKVIIYISLFILICIGFLGLNIYLDNKTNNDFVYKGDIMEEIKSSDGKNVAIAYDNSGGATTSWIPCVAIRSKVSMFSYKTELVFVGYRDKYIDIEWENDNTLNVYYKCKDEDINKMVEELNGVKIIYNKIN